MVVLFLAIEKIIKCCHWHSRMYAQILSRTHSNLSIYQRIHTNVIDTGLFCEKQAKWHGCWYSVPLRYQAIGGPGIDFVE